MSIASAISNLRLRSIVVSHRKTEVEFVPDRAADPTRKVDIESGFKTPKVKSRSWHWNFYYVAARFKFKISPRAPAFWADAPMRAVQMILNG